MLLGFLGALAGVAAGIYAVYDLITSKDAIYEEDKRAKLTTGIVCLFLGIGLLVIFGEDAIYCLSVWFGFEVNLATPTH